MLNEYNIPDDQEIFSYCNKSKIRYCHFKSNIHLDRSFEGLADFDILVHKDDWKRFHKIMLKCGAKLRYGTFNTIYPGMEHWLLYDPDREKLYHFHVHYDLIFGLGDRKNYRFPELDQVFKEREQHPRHNIFIISERFELFLLVMRTILKFDPSRRIIIQVIRGYRIPSGMCAELDDLLESIDLNLFKKWCYEVYPQQATVIINFLKQYRSEPVIGYLSAFKTAKKLKEVLIPFQRTDLKTAKAFAGLRQKSRPYEVRWLPSGGKIISIIGADGAGKSTLSSDITSWLNRKLTATSLYLGKPKSKKTFKFIKKFKSIFNRIINPDEVKRREKSHVIIAKSRFKIWKKAKYFSGNGYLVVTDRYPLREFRQMPYPMDGPRLKNNSSLYKQELSIYDSIDPYPDITIVLDVDYKTAISRKGQHTTSEQIKQQQDKIHAIKQFRSSKKNNIVVIDANADYENVRRSAKKFIWHHL